MTTTTLEIVQFTLVEGKTDADLALTQGGVNEFLKEQAGFLYRSVSLREDGTYIDIVYWENLDAAKKASDALMQDPRGQAMVALCDMNNVSIQHLPIQSEAMAENCANVA